MPWFYLSFASATEFLGACVVEATDSLDAPLVAHARGCNPGGEVLILPTPDNKPGHLEPYKLLSKAELGEGETLGELRDRGAIPRKEITLTDLREAYEIPPGDPVVMRENTNPTREEWARRFALVAAGNIIDARERRAWPANYDRAAVLASIEDATGQALSANDPLPDSLIANAQALGLIPAELRMWIHDEPKRGDWSLAALRQWAARYELGNAIAKDEGFVT